MPFLSQCVTPSVADPDPGAEKICYGSGSRPNFDTVLDPGKNDTDQAKKYRYSVPENS